MNELTGSKGCLATDTRSLREIAPLLENWKIQCKLPPKTKAILPP
jgi:hypothetical protein